MFVYDNQITDKENGIRIDITICDLDDDAVQLRIKSGHLDIPFWLALSKAGLLAEMLRTALDKLKTDC